LLDSPLHTGSAACLHPLAICLSMNIGYLTHPLYPLIR
jgi:hypothetical protein